MAINKPYLIFSWRNDILIWVTIRQFRLIGAVAFLQSCEMGLGGLNQNHRIANSSFIKRSIKIKASNQNKQHQARDLKSKATNNNTGAEQSNTLRTDLGVREENCINGIK